MKFLRACPKCKQAGLYFSESPQSWRFGSNGLRHEASCIYCGHYRVANTQAGLLAEIERDFTEGVERGLTIAQKIRHGKGKKKRMPRAARNTEQATIRRIQILYGADFAMVIRAAAEHGGYKGLLMVARSAGVGNPYQWARKWLEKLKRTGYNKNKDKEAQGYDY